MAIVTDSIIDSKTERNGRRSGLYRVGSVRGRGVSLEDLDRAPCVGGPVEFDQRNEKPLRVVGTAFFQGPGFQLWAAERDGLTVAEMFFRLSRQSYAF